MSQVDFFGLLSQVLKMHSCTFSLFCPGPRPRRFLLFGPVLLVAVSSFAFAHLGAWRPSSAVLRVSCRVNQESAPAERLRAVVLAQADDPRFGAAGLLPFRGLRQNVLAIMAPRVNEEAGGPKKKRGEMRGQRRRVTSLHIPCCSV